MKIFISLILIISAHAGQVSIGWNGDALGYKVYRGIDLLADVKENKAIINLPEDQISDVFVVAYNGTLSSDPSESIKLIPIITQKSLDLKAWMDLSVTYSQKIDKEFYRVKFYVK